MRKITLTVLVLMMIALVLPVMAQDNNTYISFSDTRMVKSDIEISMLNQSSGQYERQGIWNTSSAGLVFSPGIYSVIINPGTTNPIFDPNTAAASFMAFLEQYWLGLLIFAVIIALVVRRR